MDSKDLLHFVQTQQPIMINQLHHWCGINSGTTNRQGLVHMCQALQWAYQELADTIQIKTLPASKIITLQGEETEQPHGEVLLISKRPHLTNRVLLCGHMDTVYSEHHPFQTLTSINDNKLKGPGVADMKGGLIVMLHALSAFEQSPLAKKLGWDVFINSDEEVGSPASRLLLNDMASSYQTALVYEPAMTDEGTLAKNRKGSGKFTLVAQGKTAHAGRDFTQGRNAICYLAEAIVAINQLNGLREYLTINVGQIAGGHALNIVPDCAVAKLDIRINQTKDQQWVSKELSKILAKLKRKDYSLTLHGDFARPVKRINPATKELFKRVQLLGSELGLAIDWKDSGGCCDGNNLAQFGMAVVDTLGVRGGAIHSMEEYILLLTLRTPLISKPYFLTLASRSGLLE